MGLSLEDWAVQSQHVNNSTVKPCAYVVVYKTQSTDSKI